MRATLYDRELVLAALALLGVLAALAFTALRHPAAALPAAIGSYTGVAGSTPPSAAVGRLTSCGVRVDAATEGVENPVLACGLRVYLSYRGTSVLASVIGNGPTPQGREFQLTAPLARRLGLVGARRIRWSYAAAPGALSPSG